jgi:hypothetical protein
MKTCKLLHHTCRLCEVQVTLSVFAEYGFARLYMSMYDYVVMCKSWGGLFYCIMFRWHFSCDIHTIITVFDNWLVVMPTGLKTYDFVCTKRLHLCMFALVKIVTLKVIGLCVESVTFMTTICCMLSVKTQYSSFYGADNFVTKNKM